MFTLLLLIVTAAALPVLPEASSLAPLADLSISSTRTNIIDGVTVAPEIISTGRSILHIVPEAPVLTPLKPYFINNQGRTGIAPEFNFVFPTPKPIEQPIIIGKDLTEGVKIEALPSEEEKLEPLTAQETASQPIYVRYELPNFPFISPLVNPVLSPVISSISSGLGGLPIFGGLFGNKSPSAYSTYSSFRYPHYSYGYPYYPYVLAPRPLK